MLDTASGNAYVEGTRGATEMTKAIRKISPAILFLPMRITGFRFSKAYRHGETKWKAWVYSHIDTVGSNIRAGF